MAFNKLAKKLHKRETLCANMDEIGMVRLRGQFTAIHDMIHVVMFPS